MVRAAKEFNMSACGLTDHGTFAGAIDFLQECRKMEIRPIIGMEAYLCKNHLVHDKSGQPAGRRGNRHINLIAKNYKGFQNVCTLSQIASLDGFYYDPRVDLELLEKYSEGVIATSACFLGDQLVNTDRGLKRIDQLCLADKIITQKGDYVHPNTLTSRPYLGDIIHIKVRGHFGEISCTADHLVLVENKGKTQWKQASELVKNDRLLSPIISESRKCVEQYNLWEPIDKYFRFNHVRAKHLWKNHLHISPDFCYFIGLWLAGGSLGGGGRVEFTFGDHEMHLVNFVREYVKKQFNLESSFRVRTEQYRIDVTVCSEALKRLINYYFGSEVNGKRIDRIFKLSSMRCRAALVGGLVVGDGSNNPKAFGKYEKYSYASVSRSLCSDLRDICLSLGLRVSTSSVRARVDGNLVRHKKSYYLFAYGVDARVINSVVNHEKGWQSLLNVHNLDARGRKIGRRYWFVVENGVQYFSLPIKSVEVEKNISTRVFCMQENTTNTFTADGIIVHNCLSNVVNNALAHDNYSQAKKSVAIFKDIYNEDYYLEAMYHGIELEGKILPDIYKLGKEMGVKVIATNDNHYVRKEDAECQQVVMCISSGKTLNDPKRIRFPYQEFYFKSKEEMAKIFGHVPSCMTNTLEVAEKCDYSDIVLGGNMLLPKFDIPDGYKNSYHYLCKLAYDGLKNLGLSDSIAHKERLEIELGDIKLIWDTKRYDFTTYFLIVEDIMRFAAKNGIAAGVRGSGCGSLLLKCLGIVDPAIDPIKHNLLWERFLGFDDSTFLSEEDFGISG